MTLFFHTTHITIYKMSVFDDSRSVTTVNSTAQETIDSLHEETKRRNKKMEFLRNRKKVVADQPPIIISTGVGSVGDLSNDEEASIRRNVQIPSCIMTVRTQKESVESITTGKDGESSRTQIRKKRRKMNRKLQKDLLLVRIPASTNGPSSYSSLSPELNQAASEMSVCSYAGVKEHEPLTSTLSYNSVTIREYAFIPGDNPSVSRGVPITIDWEHQWERTFDLDAFEHGKTPRHQIEMKIPAEIRSQLLRDNGHSWKDIQASIKMANIARRQRTKTIERLPSEKMDEKLEKMARGMKNIFKDKKKKPEVTGGSIGAISDGSDYEDVQDDEQNSYEKDEIDVSLSKSSNKYDLSPPCIESKQENVVCILSEDLSECLSTDEQSDNNMSFATCSVMGMKDCDQNAHINSSERSDPSNDTSSTEESLLASDRDIFNHSYPDETQQNEYDRKTDSRHAKSNENNPNSRTKTRKMVTMLEYGSEYNSEENEKGVEIDVCCGGAFGRAGKLLLQTRQQMRHGHQF
mmetsp:Transcript_9491/g.17859  ORF Transcript_9491/g.17859 Transcript_9491/m.17859 type:complete len:520 (+) Transcript_9491:5-1564(+)